MALTYQAVQNYSDRLHGVTRIAVSPTNYGLLAGAPVASANVPTHKRFIEFGISPGFATTNVVRQIQIVPDTTVTGDDIKAV